MKTLLEYCRNKMIKEVEIIKMRKDMDYLLENYFNKSSLAKALNVNTKVLRDFVIDGVTPQDSKFETIHKSLENIKEQIKKAEEYQPLEQPQDNKQKVEWLLMHEILEKQNESK